jgi:7-carboxy-7-deazaguanine synthase (Cx14CxxC type)
MYAVKEIFYTLQGEGANAGSAAVFCRFAGCNLWSGREQDRAQATCQFCDTDFVSTDGEGGGKFVTAEDLAEAVLAQWTGGSANRLVVLTGGEPGLQVDAALVDALHAKGFRIAMETNGTLAVADGVDWICVSPKAGTSIVQTRGDELKLVYPQAGLMPDSVKAFTFTHRFLQPMDGPDAVQNTDAAVRFCKSHPEWRLSLQTHKLIGIP